MSFYRGRPDSLAGRPANALHKSIRLNQRDEGIRRRIVEDDGGVDRIECRHNLRALLGGCHRTRAARDAASGPVGIDGHDEGVPLVSGRLKVADMSGMQEVVDPVREDHPSAGPSKGVGKVADAIVIEDGHTWSAPVRRYGFNRNLTEGENAQECLGR